MISRRYAIAVAAAAIGACGEAPRPLPPAERFTVGVPDERTVNAFAISPDGARLAYSAESASDGRRRIFVGAVGAAAAPARELPDTIGGSAPFFAPDGSEVGYFARGWIWRVSASGDGVPRRVVEAPPGSAGGAWTPGGHIVFAPLGTSGLMQTPADGGSASSMTVLDQADGELEHGWPHALDDGSIVFTVSMRGRDSRIEILAEGKRTRLRVPIIGHAQFVETGHLVYSYLGNLMAVRFDPRKMATIGVPAVMAKGMQTGTGFGALGRSGFAVSRTGTLVWLRSSPQDAQSRLVRVSRDGRVATLEAPAGVFQTPRLTPDGRRLAVAVRSGVMTREIRVLDAAQPARTVATIAGGDNQSPAWMDNRRLSFGSNREGAQKIYVVSIPGSTPPAALFTVTPSAARNPASWTRPPRLLALYEIDPTRGRNVLVYRAGESIVPVAATHANERSPVVSADGRQIAYVSDASGRDEVYLARLDRSVPAVPLTATGATEPVWGRDGLYYREGDAVMRRPIERDGLGAAAPVFEGHFERDPGSNAAAYDIDPKGQAIMLKSAAKPNELRVVSNWGTELTAALGAGW